MMKLLFFILVCQKKKRKYWVHLIKAESKKKREFNLVKELFSYEDKFYKYFHCTTKEFFEILYLIKGVIKNENTGMKRPISEMERLAVTLK